MSSSQQQQRRGRGGGGRGNGANSSRSSRSNRGGSRRGNAPNRSGGRGGRGSNRASDSTQGSAASAADGMRDEEVLIAFMPYLKGSHDEATKIHEEYQASNDQPAFLRAARAFLQREKSGGSSESLPSQQQQPQQQQQKPPPSAAVSQPSSSSTTPSTQPQPPPPIERTPLFATEGGTSSLPQQQPSSGFLLPPATVSSSTPAPNASVQLTPPGMTMNKPATTATQPNDLNNDPLNNLPPAFENLLSLQQSNNNTRDPGALASLPGGSMVWGNQTGGGTIPVPLSQSSVGSSATTPQAQSPWNAASSSVLAGTFPPASVPNRNQPAGLSQSPPKSDRSPLITSAMPPSSPSPATASTATTASTTTASEQKQATSPRLSTTATTTTIRREAPPPKRLWMHFEQQPGRILVDGYTGQDPSLVLPMAPRDDVVAHWSLPIDYILHRTSKTSGAKNVNLEHALSKLTVGLFRRGCSENSNGIISKSVLGDNNRSYDYWKDTPSNSVRGKVPFFSPRTPGHVLFRMYWDNDPVYTLATGPTLRVRISESDFESSIRFILSNFKGRKTNPTSLSSLHSLALALETPLSRPNESAARVTWGCIQEARKVIDACAAEYAKATHKLAALEETVKELKEQVEGEEKEEEGEKTQHESDDDGPSTSGGEHQSAAAKALNEKVRALASGRASSERKWRDSQLAFSSILRAVVTNPTIGVVLPREMIARLRCEYELWCPLSEEFAIPGNDSAEGTALWYESLKTLPQAVTRDHFVRFAQARGKMQMRTLGFEPNTLPLDDILFPRNNANPDQRSMDPVAVGVLNNISAAMGQYYQELFKDEPVVLRKRELIRERTEKCVRECGAFPPGTRVVIFGSAANGFGSPKSDQDMCLQLPEGSKLSADDKTGSVAMAKLAEHFEMAGMKDVDTVRLTARVPIIRYFCPDPLGAGDGDEVCECDLSMHNPLAVLNTGLLGTYASISPVTRVLAAVVKRWAKARDINNPAQHTLSSYGYIIMILHFLTYHKRRGNGLLSPLGPPEGNRNMSNQLPTPLLPNLQWMDPMWLSYPKGTPYRELSSIPVQPMSHPLDEQKSVNTYFFSPKTPNEKTILQTNFSGEDLSLAILLASFFRYYAYEFDYKLHVVSLHSTATRGMIEREVKAELDGWRNFSAALTIEDPFESFYDIAHVLRGGYYHRIRREFSVAYSKIADAVSRRPGSWKRGDLSGMSGSDIIDWICDPISQEKED